MKTYRKSLVTWAMYGIAILILGYTFYTIVTISKDIASYYGELGQSIPTGEFLIYLVQNALQYFIWSALIFSVGFAIDEIRKLNPAYYRSKEDLEDVKKAKEEVKAAKRSYKEKTAPKPMELESIPAEKTASAASAKKTTKKTSEKTAKKTPTKSTKKTSEKSSKKTE